MRVSSIKKYVDGFITKHYRYHYVRSELLNGLLVSFRWQPIINEELISIFHLWENSEGYEVPDLIFLGKYYLMLLHGTFSFNVNYYLFFYQLIFE